MVVSASLSPAGSGLQAYELDLDARSVADAERHRRAPGDQGSSTGWR